MNLKYIIVMCILILLIPIVSSVPELTDYNNSISNNQFPHVDLLTNIQFNVTANESVNYHWYVDNVNQSHNYDNFTIQWDTSGHKNVSVYGTNVNGSTLQITWNVFVKIGVSTGADEVATLSSEPYDVLITAISGENPDFEGVLSASTMPYTNIVGNVFYLIIICVPLFMLWIRQENKIIPVVLGLSLGGIFLMFMPEQYIPTAILLILISVTGILYTLFKQRGT